MQSHLSLIIVIITKLPSNVFSGFRGGHLSSKNILLQALKTQISSAAKHWISNPAKQITKYFCRTALLNVGSQHAWSIRHFSLSLISLFDFADPNCDMVNHILSPGAPVLPSPYSHRHPHRGWGI